MKTPWYHLNLNKAVRLFLITMSFSLTLVNCAKRGSPTGGPQDSLPPVFVKATPPNFTTNFEGNEIRVYFDEYIKLKDFQKQFIASPPLSNTVVSPQGSASKYIKIELRDTLEENTTYVFNFGLSIADNNEGNAFPSFKYVMSTGDYIDSLTVKGSIIDAVLPEADDYVTVMLYEVDSTFTDSTVFNERPRYVTNTLDSLTTFTLDYLRKGTYALIALKDADNNFTFQPKKDKIAFADQFITVPTDSSYTLKLFNETLAYKVSRPKHAAQGRIAFGVSGIRDSISIEMTSQVDKELTSLVTQKGEDTLYYWYKPRIEVDSLLFSVSAPSYSDTLVATIRTPKQDSLEITAKGSKNILFNKTYDLDSNIPLDSLNKKLISVIKDSISLPFEAKIDSNRMKVRLDFDKSEDTNYTVTLLPGAVTDFFGQKNDSIIKKGRTKEKADYGDIELTLKNAENFPYIVQLLDAKNTVLESRYSTGETVFKFEYLNPSKYKVRLIEDANGNTIFDTGNYLKKRQPERVINYPGEIEVRSSWYAKEIFELQSISSKDPALEESIPE